MLPVLLVLPAPLLAGRGVVMLLLVSALVHVLRAQLLSLAMRPFNLVDWVGFFVAGVDNSLR
jgi:hypothetical protein